MAFSKYVITNAGRDLLLGCMATGDFQIRSLVLGSGEYSGLMTEIEDVVAPVMTFSGESLTVVKRGSQLEIRAKLTNEALSSGFEWREYGVYATNGTGTVLYCYDNAGNDPVPISSASGGTAISNTVKVILTIDNDAVANISFQPDPDITIDDIVTADGENAVSGAAVYSFAGGGIPTPTSSDSGKALVVGSDGKYALGMTSVNTTTDPGAGATSSYPDGTEINVYE